MSVNQPNKIKIDADIIDCYFPIMLAGQIICSIGTGLLIMIGTTTPIVAWAAFMVVGGFGDGMCTNMPYTAIQSILEE